MTQFRFLIITVFILPLTSYANQYESVDHLKSIVTHYLEKKVTIFSGEHAEITVSHINTGAHLPKCDRQVKPSLLHSNDHDSFSSVRLSCKGAKPWTIYVPAHIKIIANVAVARRHLPKGHIIHSKDIKVINRNRVPRRNGYYQSITPLIGMVTTHSIHAGKTITQRAITPQTRIHKGEVVIISAHTGKAHIETKGIAQSAGILNHHIKVLNKSSKRVVDAIVTGPAHVESPM